MAGGCDQKIEISILVPACRAARTIERTLLSLAAQDYPRERYEVVIVFSGPDDGTQHVVQSFKNTHPDLEVKIISSETNSVGAARNIGLDECVGSHVMFVDAGDWVSSNYVSAMAECVAEMRIPIAGMVEVKENGVQVTNNVISDWHKSVEGRFCLVDGAASPSAMNACKLIPRALIGDSRFNEELSSGEDVVFYGKLFQSFLHRYYEYDRLPYENGACYYRSLISDGASRKNNSFDFNVVQRLAVIRELTAGWYANWIERPRLTNSFVKGQLRIIEKYVATVPRERERVEKIIDESGVAGISLSNLGGADSAEFPWPSYEILAIPQKRAVSGPKRIIIFATSAWTINAYASCIQLLQRVAPVTLFYMRNSLSPSLKAINSNRILVVPVRRMGDQVHSLPLLTSAFVRIDQVVRKAINALAPGRVPLSCISKHQDNATVKLRSLAVEHSVVIALGADGVKSLQAKGVKATGGLEVLHALTLSGAARDLPISRQLANAVSRAASFFADSGKANKWLPPAPVWAMAAWRLLRSSRADATERLLRAGGQVFPRNEKTSALNLLQAIRDTRLSGQLPPQAFRFAEDALSEADEAFNSGDKAYAAVVLSWVLDLLVSHDALTAEGVPLFAVNHNAVLELLAKSVTWQKAIQPLPVRHDQHQSCSRKKKRVLVIAGAYPKFMGPVAASLEQRADVNVLDLGALDRTYGTVSVAPSEVGRRLGLQAQILDQPEVLPVLENAMSEADVVFVDWADKGALLASQLVSGDTKMVIRFHGIDTLSPWQFMIDWSRVSDVAFVSEHLRDFVVPLLGEKIMDCGIHILPNAVDFKRFEGLKTDDAHRRLGMVGWGQRVKDPLWAVEVLALLRKQDSRWKMRLIGNDFPVSSPRYTEAHYAERFRARITKDDVRDGLEFVGFTKQLPKHLCGIGFAISSSVRESFHIGAMEMVASGAVPVIRNWPTYREYRGAANIFGEKAVVETPEQAAERILQFADRQFWEEEVSGETREKLVQRFSQESLVSTYLDVVLGER